MSGIVSPLPLNRDGSDRFLPWLIALMVFVAALSIAGASVIDSGLARWNRALQGSFTAELPKPESGALAKDKLDAVVALLNHTPGITDARPLDDKATAKLLEPWLGSGIEIGQLPLPTLIDIKLDGTTEIDRPALEKQLGSIVPGSIVERRGVWLDTLFRVARAVEIGLSIIVLLIGAVAILAVIFTTKTGLALHAALIELLHLMGASDAYIAGQFQRHAFRLGLRGGIIGLLGAFLAIGILRFAREGMGEAGMTALFLDDHLPVLALAGLFSLPFVMGGVGWLTARQTVLRSLAKMP